MLRKEQSFICNPKEIFHVRTYLYQYTPPFPCAHTLWKASNMILHVIFLYPIKLDISNIPIYHILHFTVSFKKNIQSFGTDYFDEIIRPYCCSSCKLHHLSCMTILAKWNITKLKTKGQAIKIEYAKDGN